MSRLLKLREKMNRKRPKFLRQEHHKLRRFKNDPTWRKPAGKSSKMRTKKASKQDMPDIGWRGPRAVRGFHPSGLKEMLVHSASELENAKDVVVKVASCVGQRNKVEIVRAAQKKGLKMANPAFRMALRSVDEIEDILPIKAYARLSISKKISEDEKKKIEEGLAEHGLKAEAVA